MSSAALSKYRPPPRPQERTARTYRRGGGQPRLLQFVVLSMCLHALAILLFGAPSGGNREGRAMWGALEVRLQESYREALPNLRIERVLEGLRKEPDESTARTPRNVTPPPPQRVPRPAPPVRLNPAREITPPRMEVPPASPLPPPPPAPAPLPVPAPVRAPEQVAPQTPARSEEAAPPLFVPPMIDRLAPLPKLEKLEAFTVPPPTENQAVTQQPTESKAPAKEMKAVAPLPRIEEAPLPRVEAPTLPSLATPPQFTPAVPPPVEMKPLAPMSPIESAPLPTLAPAPPPRLEAVPVPVVPATPPVKATPLEAPSIPVPRQAVTAPPMEAPLSAAPETPALQAPAIPQVPAPQAVPAAPAVPAAVPVAPADTAAPALPSAREPRAASPSVPRGEDESSRFRAAPDAGRAPPADYDPTKPPSVDLDAVRSRAAQLARQGTGNRALLAFPMPPVPKDKSKLEKGLEKAWKPDCKTAYSSLGLAAVVPLVANEFGDGNCRW